MTDRGEDLRDNAGSDAGRRPPAPAVRTAAPDDAATMAAVLGRAFADDPVMGWILPDERSRAARLTRMFGILLRRVHLEHGATEVAGRDDRIEAAAIWDPPDRWRIPPARQARLALPLMVRVFGRRLPVGLRALGTIERRHPEEPHWYLSVLGADPPAQGGGLGGALLRSRLARCDEAGLPSYLESSKESNVPYYERFGFKVTGEVAIPGGGPTVWLMWRDPQTA